MKFFRLKNSFNTKEIGRYPQVEKINRLGDLFKIEEIGNTSKINFKWDIPEPIMKKKANVTTLLSVIPFTTALFLTFEKSFINFLENFSVGDFSTWELKIHHKDEVLNNYRLFHLSYPSDDKYIDFEKSDFITITSGGRYEDTSFKPVKINNLNNYLNSLEVVRSAGNLTVTYNKLVLDFSNATEDIIRFIDVTNNLGYYVSERLKNAIEEKGFTGIAFQEIEEMDKRIKVIY